MRQKMFGLLLGLTLCMACHKKTEPGVVLKVYVDHSGVIFVEDRPTSLADLEKVFQELAKQKGTVWYARHNPQGEPPPNATEVMVLIIKYQLAVSLSTSREFNDIVDEKGQVRKPT